MSDSSTYGFCATCGAACTGEAWDHAMAVLQVRVLSVAHDHAKAVAERDEARVEADTSYAIIENLRAKLARYEAVVSAARPFVYWSGQTPSLEQRALELRAALRALDDDPGGSGNLERTE